jgi:hypothetical protein
VLLAAVAALSLSLLMPPTPFKIHVGKDRVTVRDGARVYQIATTANGVGNAGPGYIYRAAKAGRVVVDDSKRGEGNINDPDYGGIGTFGFHLGRKLEGEQEFVGNRAWHLNNAWPIDGRRASARDGFGVRQAKLLKAGNREVAVRVWFADPWDPNVAVATYRWKFKGGKAHLSFTVRFRQPQGPQAFIKEPKLAVSASNVPVIRSKSSKWGGALPKTGQSRPTRFPIGMGSLRVTPHKIWPGWVGAASGRPQFGPVDGPGDHVVWKPGPPTQKWEFIRRANRNGTVLFTGWEGGRGPYDAEPLSRLMVNETRKARLTVQL